MFFQMSFFKVVLVTHRIVYPAGSKLVDAAAIAEHVFPVPTEWYNNIPLTGAYGVK
jgi:hypothetical protein